MQTLAYPLSSKFLFWVNAVPLGGMKIRPDADMVGHEMFPFCDRIDKEGYRNHDRQALSAQAHYPRGMQHPLESTIQVLSEWG
jgi:hypothetical protein